MRRQFIFLFKVKGAMQYLLKKIKCYYNIIDIQLIEVIKYFSKKKLCDWNVLYDHLS
jgi:hypothetical protein